MRKLIASLVLAVLLLVGCSDQETIRINWEIGLPVGGSTEYETSSGASFHGDGIRYHVFLYGTGEDLVSCIAWQEPSSTAAAEANALQDEITVAMEDRTDFSECPHWKGTQRDHSQIYLFLSGQRIYVIEEFL